eukprot:TRINITY_DN3799_c0_g1_i2.p1 TRINITY_DN3799_c0_g1~~TRINITY_DN3799_c0_g1_i2.p1  ORF type:complete len:160 (+),score=37.27 TRINITY_DN3799_c0_g1_i2:276-755(+)
MKEKQKLQEAEKNIKEQLVQNCLVDFLVSVESAYSMITYINHLPGLVHFILVDRTDNRVYAPGITTMFGAKSTLGKNKKVNREVTKLLKRSIWDLCYEAQEFLARGRRLVVAGCRRHLFSSHDVIRSSTTGVVQFNLSCRIFYYGDAMWEVPILLQPVV